MFKSVAVLTIMAAELLSRATGRFTESERVANWHEHHTWPPTWQVENDGYRALMEMREREIMQITGSDERWENWMQFSMQRMLPSFTKKGYELTRMPKDLFKRLQEKVNYEIENNWETLRTEGAIDVVNTHPDRPSKMIDLGPLSKEIHQALLPLHEKWAGIKLRPSSIYGVRAYQNGSSLLMHVDKPQTHVISCILHVGHEYDSDDVPWTIDVENLKGELVSVSLKAGDMLFYESAKTMHGRLGTLKGKYYAGMFVHYQPADAKDWGYKTDDFINAIPPHWSDGVVEQYGSRWAGQCLTHDSRICDGTPPRVVGGNNPRNSYTGGRYPPKLDNWYTSYPDAIPRGLVITTDGGRMNCTDGGCEAPMDEF
jgi:hypothetical protein